MMEVCPICGRTAKEACWHGIPHKDNPDRIKSLDKDIYYLQTRDWLKDANGLWHDKTLTCNHACCIEVALSIQYMRDKQNAKPWYKKFFGIK